MDSKRKRAEMMDRQCSFPLFPSTINHRLKTQQTHMVDWIHFLQWSELPNKHSNQTVVWVRNKIYHINSLSMIVVRLGILAQRKIYTIVFEFVFCLHMRTFPWNNMFFWRRGEFKIVDHWLSPISIVIPF